MKTLLCIFALSISCMAQDLPNAPKPQLDKVEWSLLAADASVRTIDTITTRQMLERGNQENILPQFVVNHTPILIGVEAGMVGINYLLARELYKHNHQRVARVITGIDVASTGYWGIHNIVLPDHRMKGIK